MTTGDDLRRRLAELESERAKVEAQIVRDRARLAIERAEIEKRQGRLVALDALGLPGRSAWLMLATSLPMFNFGLNFAGGRGSAVLNVAGPAIMIALVGAFALRRLLAARRLAMRSATVSPTRARVAPELAEETDATERSSAQRGEL